MKVDKDSFSSAMATFNIALGSASFIAIDCEFSGLILPNDDKRKRTQFDSPNISYNDAKQIAMTFSLMQLGICTYEYDESKDAFIAYPFSFYCYPHDENQVIQCQIGSLSFLGQNGFDFNRWINKGVSYTSFYTDKMLRLEKKKKQAQTERRDKEADVELPALEKQHDIEFVADLRQRIKGLMERETLKLLGKRKRKKSVIADDEDIVMEDGDNDDDSNSSSNDDDEDSDGIQISDVKVNNSELTKHGSIHEKASETFKPRNGFQRLLVYQILRLEFPKCKVEKVENSIQRNAPYMKVKYLSENEWKLERSDKGEGKYDRKFNDYMNHARGVRAVIDALIVSGKPIVGFSCLQDLCFMFNSFIYPLPDYVEFKRSLHYLLPKIYDVQCLLRHSEQLAEFKYSNLQAVYDGVASMKDIQLPNVVFGKDEKHNFEITDAEAHDAGYDAYMTGRIFSCLYKNQDILSLGLNKICIFRSQVCIHLSGADTHLNEYSGVFYCYCNNVQPTFRLGVHDIQRYVLNVTMDYYPYVVFTSKRGDKCISFYISLQNKAPEDDEELMNVMKNIESSSNNDSEKKDTSSPSSSLSPNTPRKSVQQRARREYAHFNLNQINDILTNIRLQNPPFAIDSYANALASFQVDNNTTMDTLCDYSFQEVVEFRTNLKKSVIQVERIKVPNKLVMPTK